MHLNTSQTLPFLPSMALQAFNPQTPSTRLGSGEGGVMLQANRIGLELRLLEAEQNALKPLIDKGIETSLHFLI